MEGEGSENIPRKISDNPEKIEVRRQEQERREVYDQAFVDALEELKRDAHVEEWEFTKQNSPDDVRGVDVWVKINGEDVPVNLKGRKLTKENRRRAHVLQNHGVIIIRMVTKMKGALKTPDFLGSEFKQKVISRENLRTHLYIKR